MDGYEVQALLHKICKEFLTDRHRYIEHLMGDEKFSLVLYAVAVGEDHGGSIRADVTSKNFPDSVTGALRDFIQPSLTKELLGELERQSASEGTEISS